MADIVPTPVGVNRSGQMVRLAPHHCPHARGGEPAGERRIAHPPDCPHARGGEPRRTASTRSIAGLSPRPWG